MSDQLSSDLASLRIDRDAPTPPSGAKRLLVPLLVIGAIGAGGYVAWTKLEGQIMKQEVKTTEVALISPSQAEVQVTATGYVIPQRTSKVGSKLPGRLAKVFVKEGDTVTEGQIRGAVEAVIEKEPNPEEINQVASRLASVGWPLAGAPASPVS